MPIEISRLGRVFGDRILVKKLERPDKLGSIYVPANYSKDPAKQQDLWWGVIEKFGLDSRFGEAYGLKEGDIIGMDPIGGQSASFDGDDGNVHCWVAEEFVVCKDMGLVIAYRNGEKYFSPDSGNSVGGLRPLAFYSVVKPHPIEEKRGALHIPDTAKKEALTGKVLCVSDGYLVGGDLSPLRVTQNSEVLFGKYSGWKATLGDTVLVLVREEDLIAEIEPAKETANVG